MFYAGDSAWLYRVRLATGVQHDLPTVNKPAGKIPEFWFKFQPAQRFHAVSPLQMSEKADKQHWPFTADADVADHHGATVQGTRQEILIILTGRDNAFLLPRDGQSAPFQVEVDIHFVFIKYRVVQVALHRAAFMEAIVPSLFGSRMRSVGAALRHINPVWVSHRRPLDVCK